MKAGIAARLLTAAFTTCSWCICMSHAAEAVVDDGAQIRLIGVIKREQAEDIEEGIQTNGTIWVLHLSAPFTLRSEGLENSAPPILTPNVQRVQLALRRDQYARYADLFDLGAHVTVQGSVFMGINAHHHTPALIDVESIESQRPVGNSDSGR